MTCDEFRRQFPAYADGRVPDALARAIEAHLERCAECEARLGHEGAPLLEARGLSRSLTPSYDLWPGIEARLAPRLARGRIVVARWMLAAAAVLLIALSSALTALWLRSPGTSLAPRPSAGVEAEYAAASAELLGALEQARSRLAPETIATIERNLGVIDQALAESRRALARDPGNPALSQLVVAAWRQKLDLLRRATALGGAG
jgi:predicted anti-sigma-YlaC factor YlaD